MFFIFTFKSTGTNSLEKMAVKNYFKNKKSLSYYLFDFIVSSFYMLSFILFLLLAIVSIMIPILNFNIGLLIFVIVFNLISVLCIHKFVFSRFWKIISTQKNIVNNASYQSKRN